MATQINIKWKLIGVVVCAHLLASPCNTSTCEGECKCTSLGVTALLSELQRNQVYGKCVCHQHNSLPREYTDAYALEIEYLDHAVLGDYCAQTFPNLLYLSISGFQYILPGRFAGHGKVKHLRLLSEYMHVIEQNVFTGLDCLEQLWADTCGIYALKDGAFLGLPKLTTLSLTNNSIWSIHEDSFLGLSSLLNLDLSLNKISELPRGHFRHLSKLQKLNLATNSITHVERGAFQGLTSLQFLDLQNNLLKILPQPRFFMGEVYPHNSFVTVYLHGNSLRCYCQMSWVYKCMDIDRFIIEGTCTTPKEVEGQTLNKVYSTSMDKCKPNGTEINVPSGTKAELPCTIAYAVWLLPDGTKITERGQCWDDYFLSDNNYLVIWNTKYQHTGTYVCQSPDEENEMFYHVSVPESHRLSFVKWVSIASSGFVLAVVVFLIAMCCRRRNYENLGDEAHHQPRMIVRGEEYSDSENDADFHNIFEEAD